MAQLCVSASLAPNGVFHVEEPAGLHVTAFSPDMEPLPIKGLERVSRVRLGQGHTSALTGT